ncbi:MAG: mechanosensitive ion channel domain-containing protein [Phycisphaerales bacterium JB037]
MNGTPVRWFHPVRLVLIVTLASASAWAAAQPRPVLNHRGATPIDESVSQPEQPAQPAAPAITAAEINDRLAAIAQDASLDEATKKSLTDTYNNALAALATADSAAARRADARKAAEEAPGKLAAIRESLATPIQPPNVSPPSDATRAQIERSLAQAQAELQAARKEADELQAEATRRRDRRAAIPEQIAQAKRRLTDLESSLAGLTGVAEPTPAQRAQQALLQAQRYATASEVAALEAELESYDARQELLPARRDASLRRVTEKEAEVNAWQELVNRRRQLEAQQQAREAERLRLEAARQHPVLQEFAAESKELADRRAGEEGILTKSTQVNNEASQRETQLNRIREQYKDIKRRIQVSGFNRTVGRQLRRQFENLPELADPTDLRKRLAAIQQELEAAEYELYELQERRLGMGDTESVAQRLLDDIDPSETEATPEELQAIARDLAVARRDTLDGLIADLTRYIDDGLVPLELVTADLREAAEAYESFIRERILWVRSVSSETTLEPRAFVDAGVWLADPQAWRVGVSRVSDDIVNRWPTTGFVVVLLGAMFVAGHMGRRRIKELKSLVGRFSTDSIRHTFEATLWTLIGSAALPALLWWLGWLLAKPIDQSEQMLAVGTGLQASALLLFPLVFLQRMTRAGGLADAHFRWPTESLRIVRRHLRWLTPTLVVTMALAEGYDRHAPEVLNGALGRASFTIGLLALAVALQRLLRPKGAVLSDFLSRNAGGWIDRLRYVWFPAVVGLPVVLIIASWAGYHYTALQLEHRFESTLGLVLLIAVINGLMLRWLFLARRRVAVENARRRREQAQSESAGTAPAEVPTESGVAPVEEHKLDLPAVSAQTRQLIRTGLAVALVLGLFTTWAGVLPALRMLDRVQVWPSMEVIDEEDRLVIPVLEPAAAAQATDDNAQPAADAPAGEASTGGGTGAGLPLPGVPATSAGAGSESTAIAAVTLADLGLALVLLAATIVAFRNVPGLVDIVVLQRLPLDAGSRFALSTVLRYLIAMIGLVAAFGAMSISWNNVQWLAAALTFGLAFGLQEIFANFVSGLIILAERPIRIGDTVTVNNISGTVTKIRMRATTITDWDRKELVIPNKTFITGEVVNWTLSDPTLRLSIPVGVAYSADIRNAEATLLRVARANPIILKEPAPYVFFTQFGDSTLNFELRCFLPSVEHLVSVKHALHMAITEAFREENIEIAFPQRDLHIRSIGDLAGLVRARDAKPAGDSEPRELEPQSH